MPSRPWVLVFDDEEVMRSLYTRLAAHAGYRTHEGVGTFEALRLALRSYKHLDILIFDIVIDGVNGLNQLRSLQRSRPRLKIIVVTGHHEEVYVHQALKLGCEGMLWKNLDGNEEFLAALAEVSAGRTYLSSTVRHLDNRQRCIPKRPLTFSQWQLYRRLHQGDGHGQIAAGERTSIRNIAGRVSRLRTTLGIPSTQGKVNWRQVIVVAPNEDFPLEEIEA